MHERRPFSSPAFCLLGGASPGKRGAPELRFSTNIAWLSFDNTATLEKLRQQSSISREIGWDISGAIIYRPLFTNNIVLRVSGAVLVPGDGWKALYKERASGTDIPYSVLANVILTY